MILKLMIVEIKRYLRSLYYLVVLFILFLIHMLGLKGGVPFLFWGDDFLEKTATWDEEKNIAENSVMTEEDAKKLMGEDAQVTEFQNNVEEITFLGEKHYAAQYTFKNYDVSYYGVTVFLVNEQDSQYMLAVNIIGVDLNVVDQADQFFSVYTE